MTEKKKQKFRIRSFHDVDSTNLKRIYYSVKYKTLVVQFHSGSYYFYPDVPRWQYRRLMNATSHGGYFAAFIRDSYQSFAFDLNEHIEGVAEAELLQQLEDSLKELKERRDKAS